MVALVEAGQVVVEMEDLEVVLEAIIVLKPEEQEGIQEEVPAVILNQVEAVDLITQEPTKITKLV
jgi:hypothetical protein